MKKRPRLLYCTAEKEMILSLNLRKEQLVLASGSTCTKMKKIRGVLNSKDVITNVG